MLGLRGFAPPRHAAGEGIVGKNRRCALGVVNAIRATGKGYNARVKKVLRDALAKGKL